MPSVYVKTHHYLMNILTSTEICSYTKPCSNTQFTEKKSLRSRRAEELGAQESEMIMSKWILADPVGSPIAYPHGHPSFRMIVAAASGNIGADGPGRQAGNHYRTAGAK